VAQADVVVGGDGLVDGELAAFETWDSHDGLRLDTFVDV
jgi:hypothetical protein